MFGMFDKLVGWIKEGVKTTLDWFSSLTGRQRLYAVAGVVVVGGAAWAGGFLMQAMAAALLINVLMWMLITESGWAMQVLRRWGGKIDAILTICSIFFSPATGVLAWLAGAMFGAIFSIFRNLIVPVVEVVKDATDVAVVEVPVAA
jgi:hypothetical protein